MMSVRVDDDIITPQTLCGDSVSLQLRIIRLAGFCRMKDNGHGAASTFRRIIFRAYHLFALFANTMHVLIRCLHAYEMRSDLSKVTQILYVTLTFVTCFAKQIVFHLKADEIEDIIARLDDPLLNQEAGAGRELMQETAHNCAWLSRIYTSSAVAWCIMWNTFPLVAKIQGRYADFLFWIGFNYDHYAVFSAVLLFSFYVTTMGGIGQTSIDVFVVTILEQCKTQLRILRLNFETLPDRAKAINEETSEPYASAVQRLLVDSVLHYNKIIELCNLLNDTFTLPLLVQFGVGVLILCMAAVEIVDLNLISVEFATTSLYIFCILLELFLFCYFGTRVTDESEHVSDSICGMEWWRTSISIHRSLLIVIERAKRPLIPAAGFIIPLSLETYVKILKSSYSFYAVLRQTTETTD